MKNDEIVWSGPLWTRNIDLNTSKITLSAVGWFEILMNRFLWDNVPSTYTSTNEGDIAISLLNIANSDFPTWITVGENTTLSNRTKTYEIWQSIGEEIINLSDIEDGFDIYLDPETRMLNLHDASQFSDRTDVQFGMNFGKNNIANLIINENGGEMRNRIQVVGANGTVQTYNSNHTAPDNSQDFNNVFTEVIQETEESNSQLLAAIANAEGAMKQWPITDYEIELKTQKEGDYELFEDYFIGDKIYVTAHKRIDGDLIAFEIEPRIFGATINLDDNNVEKVSNLQTTFSGS